MSKKKYQNIGDLLKQAAEELATEHIDISENTIPDIITFVEDPRYLGLTQQGITLYPVQRIMLKIFYYGSQGNEHLELTPEELKLCYSLGLDRDETGNPLGKYHSNNLFRELILVWGRRSGKDFISSVIALYEAMRLLECEGGDPYKMYRLGSGNPISILTVANSAGQAGLAFNEMKEKITHSAYFRDKILPTGWGQNQIFLLTPKNKEENLKLKQRGLPEGKGSIVIEVGHSNSDSLLGKQIFVLLLDEVASYKQTGGSSSGERIVTALKPSMNTFVRIKEVIDDEGNIKKEKTFDSKLICISSPRGKDGIFYSMYEKTAGTEERVACRLPTWIVNPNVTEQMLRDTNTDMTEEEFMMEFGAEFSGTAGENFFPPEHIEKCFKRSLNVRNMGQAGCIYFAHLDPATSSHNYALVIVHREASIDSETKKTDFKIVVDHIKFWHPTPGKPVIIDDVDEYVVSLKRRFYLGLVTYDHWNSSQSIKKLQKEGIPARCTPFSSRWHQIVYDELYNLVTTGRLDIPYHEQLRAEMLNLQRKYTNTGYKVYPKSEGDVRTDDIVDALAGACYSALHTFSHKLPTGRLVQFGNPSSNGIVWRSMQGVPYGVGSGEQVAARLEQRNSWPRYKR